MTCATPFRFTSNATILWCDVRQDGPVKHRLGQELHKLDPIVLQRLHPLNLRDIQTAEPDLVFVELAELMQCCAKPQP